MSIRRMVWGAALAVAAPFGPALAQDVTLTSREGGLVVSGELLGYDGTFLRLLTEHGEVSVDASGVTCDGAACPDPERFVTYLSISGAASAGQALLPPLIETFAARNGFDLAREERGAGLRYTMTGRGSRGVVAVFDLTLSTSAEGFADLLAGDADMNLSDREILPREAALARVAGLGDLTAPGRSRIVALDALVPVVAVGNPLKEISLTDLRDVVGGALQDWSDLGGAEAPVALHLGPSGSGQDVTLFRQLFGGDAPATIATTRHETGADLSAAVAEDPLALGIVPFSALGNAQVVALRGPCGIASEAEIRTLKSEDYPLTTPIFLYSPARRLAPIAQSFLDYAVSPAAQAVVRRTGFVDQFPESVPIAEQGDRFLGAILSAGDGVSLDDLKDMVEAIAGRSRLSISFRFEDGSSRLDAQSRSNVALLAQAASRGVFDGRSLLFAGFSDAQGPASTNRRLAGRRAEAVRAAVVAAADLTGPLSPSFETAAFGEAMPMACDDAAWGRRVNRRVEVWLD
ncbi:phosphate ABC transporter substrate-binding protein (PhoT family) [Palleronia aestuarii]|uniref:Phosphate ABC transporter substrate-binding protein (PhoT family) n=1 Tax=Palleronia aestuarii TaxID=568105 RepID=A0A2W7NFK6_9RHOB|nr:substrate-binding domain-containing protein [Palleronia aestuarii]PZX19008.1 phosphate ABC transporter substrate-binding protein (PhoT family) [Palleronia aestuarii]